ncbi:hypothetical protein [Anaeromyxobacter oryzae]|uniref:DUF2909 domain-containing protein n=1 Tax=Anaeromyxobacter oryzae TaxID=2918170 RepID=A0ABM7WS39_9BACT|nr:hypothetical protein [Anaeromyxobacter oryzae]BDG02285.1 hypothetical protein AMOR_12810 [Anaeromyxobacter oryzae]
MLAAASTLSRILAGAIAVFVVIASAVLLWDGLAGSMAAHRPAAGRELRAVRLRLVVGVIGIAVALWMALGMLTHAW